MERARQIRRDLITVAVVVVLLGAAMLLISSSAAFAQSAVEDQYSNATSDQYPNGSSGGGTASPTTPAPVDNTEDPSGTQATADALQSALQAIANDAASSDTTSSCDPRGSYGGLLGSPPECYVGSDSIIIPGEAYSTAPDGDAGSSTFGGYVYMPPMPPVLPGQEVIAQGLNQMAPPSSGSWEWVYPKLFASLVDVMTPRPPVP